VKARARSGGGVRLTLDEDEARLLEEWLTQLAALVAPEDPEQQDPLAAMVGLLDTGTSRPPDDAALHRLFPDGYADPEEAEEFRRFTERELRTGKQQSAQRTLETLATRDAKGRVELTPQQARDWLRSLNDLRLVLATRLGIEDDDDAWPDEGDPRTPSLLAYHWLTHVQGTLVEAVRPGLA
jgi:hypothetical protein